MRGLPWDQRAARLLVQPLAATPIRPNHVTCFTLVLALIGAGMFSSGDSDLANWAAGIFILSRFLDHFDGELARLQGTSTRFGYYFDYVVGAAAYLALFISIGMGFRDSELGSWAVVLGAAGAASALISMFANLEIDKRLFTNDGGDAIGYPGYLGFELEDGIYLIAPITWLGWLLPFFVAASIGASVYCLWTLLRLWRLMRQS